MDSGFKYRVLLADDDAASLASAAALLSKEGYLVLTARDGFEALVELQGGVPEIIVSELRMPNMSGFELLAVVRHRFPGIGVIARSADFRPADEMPEGVLADRFIPKGENSDFELLEMIRELLSRLPIRTAHVKPEVAPIWIPRTATGYVVITCPACLRSSSVRASDVHAEVVQTSSCLHCGADISYRLDRTLSKAGETTAIERALARSESGHRAVAESQKAITESNTRMAKTSG
ncbi:MAG: response regulator [Candidatus Korobacteraceae bacterium]